MTHQEDVALSVVVALISGAKDDLERCLRALQNLESPPTIEILVPYDEPVSGVTELHSQFPDVRFIFAEGLDSARARAGAGREHHDTLRTIGLKAARGRVIALTEDHAQVAPTWCRDLLRLLDEYPRIAAIGGAVECGSDHSLNRAVYYCDFGRYENPLKEGPTWYVSDSNVAYRRQALASVREAWEDDYHETSVHGAMLERGHELWLTPSSVVWQTRAPLTWASALRERYVWGRSYAGTRVRHYGAPKRLAFAGLTLVLPPLLTWRIFRGKWERKGGAASLLPLAPHLLLLHTAWALGEMAGYVTGNPGQA